MAEEDLQELKISSMGIIMAAISISLAWPDTLLWLGFFRWCTILCFLTTTLWYEREIGILWMYKCYCSYVLSSSGRGANWIFEVVGPWSFCLFNLSCVSHGGDEFIVGLLMGGRWGACKDKHCHAVLVGGTWDAWQGRTISNERIKMVWYKAWTELFAWIICK